jgi:hypothetical protein
VPAQGAPKRSRGRAGVAERPPVAPEGDGAQEADQQAAPQRDPAADLTPEDLVLKDSPSQRPKRRRAGGASKRRKHGRSR